MKQSEIIKGLDQLGKLMLSLGEDKDWQGFDTGVTQDEYENLNNLILRQVSYNGWFTEINVRRSIKALGSLLQVEKLTKWSSQYQFTESPNRVGVIMAGNIPLVGFHDLLSAR